MGSPPTPTDRSAPNGIRLDDGYRTLVAFTGKEDVAFWEKTIGPPALDGGDPIDTTTMHNGSNFPTELGFRTKASRALVTLEDFTMTAAYDPKAYVDMLDILNKETTVTIHFPDGSSYAFYGFLQTFEPGDLEEGSQPEATLTVAVTNQDPVDGTEQKPVYTAPPPPGT